MRDKIIWFIIVLLAWWGLWDIAHRIHSKYKFYPDVKTEISFDMYERPDLTWYMRFWDSDVTACKVLLLNNLNK